MEISRADFAKENYFPIYNSKTIAQTKKLWKYDVPRKAGFLSQIRFFGDPKKSKVDFLKMPEVCDLTELTYFKIV